MGLEWSKVSTSFPAEKAERERRGSVDGRENERPEFSNIESIERATALVSFPGSTKYSFDVNLEE